MSQPLLPVPLFSGQDSIPVGPGLQSVDHAASWPALSHGRVGANGSLITKGRKDRWPSQDELATHGLLVEIARGGETSG